MERYDIIIAGTGIAGISAAITAKVRRKNILLAGRKSLSEKISKSHTILNYPGLPAVSGKEFGDALLRHLEALDIPITDVRINLIYKTGGYFTVQTSSNEFIEASSVIVASGVSQDKPIPGEEEFLGRGVSRCATCDAPLYKGKPAIVIAYSPDEESEAEFLMEYASRIQYIPLYPGDVHLPDKIEILREKPVLIEGGMKAERLVTDGGQYAADGIFILGGNIKASQLVPGIKTDGAHITVSRSMETSVKGCFACGDITGPPYQYIKAAGEGNTAALSAVSYLASLNKRR